MKGSSLSFRPKYRSRPPRKSSKSTGFTAFAVSHAGPWGLLAVVAATMLGGLGVGWLLQALGLGVLVGKR